MQIHPRTLFGSFPAAEPVIFLWIDPIGSPTGASHQHTHAPIHTQTHTHTHVSFSGGLRLLDERCIRKWGRISDCYLYYIIVQTHDLVLLSTRYTVARCTRTHTHDVGLNSDRHYNILHRTASQTVDLRWECSLRGFYDTTPLALNLSLSFFLSCGFTLNLYGTQQTVCNLLSAKWTIYIHTSIYIYVIGVGQPR